jgi:hypothetical protein
MVGQSFNTLKRQGYVRGCEELTLTLDFRRQLDQVELWYGYCS